MAIQRPGSPLPPREEVEVSNIDDDSPRRRVLHSEGGDPEVDGETNTKFFRRHLVEYNASRTLRETATKVENKYKSTMMANLAVFGDVDERGSRWFRFEEPLYSRDGTKVYTAIKRERRVSRVLSHDRAEAWLTENKLIQSCTRLEPVFDEDLMLSLNFQGTIPDDVLDSFYDENESWAFKREDEDV